MQVVLRVVAGPHQGKSFDFDRHDSFIVGRGDDAHLKLTGRDRMLSRVHFLIEINPPHCRVVDLGSRNGTYVNEKRIRSKDLQHGDKIRAGDTVFELQLIAGEPSSTVDLFATEPFATVPSRSVEKVDTEDPMPAIPGYRLIRQLGRGGMGVVFLAECDIDGERCAIKTIIPAATGSEREVERFLREVCILRELKHENIVRFHAADRTGELFYFAMDFIDGVDASTLVRSHGPLPITQAIAIACQGLAGLAYAHTKSFVHRDVKPSNILVARDGRGERCFLADFGLARIYHSTSFSGLTMLGQAGGTIAFMPPEQVTDFRSAKPPADQYSAAATLYYLLTGKYVFDFDKDNPHERLRQILVDEPIDIRVRRADIPDGLANVIHTALAKNAASRFPSVAAFKRRLERFAGPS